jgi:hypothetical protein
VTCFFCGGAAHPSTGCEYSATAVACRRCTEEFWAWHRSRQHTVFRRVNTETGQPCKKDDPSAKICYFYADVSGVRTPTR